MIKIVCYAGGTCGDLVCAMIDPTDATLEYSSVRHAPERTRLKKPHLFDSDQLKHNYIQRMELMYHSIPSHDLDYHVRHSHQFIAVVVKDFLIALWAAERFKKLHTPTVWKEMQSVCGANNTREYAQMLIDYSVMVSSKTNQILQLESILAGRAAHDLSVLLGLDVSDDLYNKWLSQQ